MDKILDKAAAFFGSKHFFKFILGFFVFEAVWIALSAAYPQAFDEDFHFGLIQVYSHHWLPFLSGQPANANAYGAVARDPSYLYHYLMSFPYRLIELFVHGQTGQVILLRFINIGLFAGSLLLFRRVLQRVGTSPALANVSMLLLVLIPITPQLAAQINYDNLLMLLVGWVCLLTFRVIDEVEQHKPTARSLLILLSVCLLASLVKYEFLPIFVGVVIFLAFILRQNFRGRWRAVGPQLWQSWRTQSRRAQALLLALILISFGLFAQRDIVNLVEYHTISPNCGVVLNVSDCSSYSVWSHDYTSHQKVVSHITNPTANPVSYVGQWIYWLWYRLFFAINGPTQNFTNYPPLPLPSLGFALIGILGVVAVLKWGRRIFHNNPYIVFLSVVIILYLSALLAEGYLKYRATAVLELMNGRYLLPILLLAAAIAGKAFSITLRKVPRLKGALAIVAIFLFVQGGGFITFIARSDSSWYWSNNTVLTANNIARRVTNPVIIKGKKTYQTRLWFFN